MAVECPHCGYLQEFSYDRDREVCENCKKVIIKGESNESR